MLASRSLRSSSVGIGNIQQRLVGHSSSARQFSIKTSTTPSLRATRSPGFPKQSLIQQRRSLSLFGWGGTSKPASDPFSTPSSSADVQIGTSNTGLEHVRTVKASHATSDAPETLQNHLHLPNKIEPQAIESLQEKITNPHGVAAEKFTDVASGDVDISAASENWGYLKETCGLDFGWGPTTTMEYVLEGLHVGAGLSWTASIFALAAVLRLAMIKPLVDSQREARKMREIQPVTKPLREKYTQLMQQGDRNKAMQIGAELREVNKSAGISYKRAFIPLLIQIPFSFGAFRVLRNAGQLPVPAFVTEDWLWTTDLSFSDPYFITPAISAATIYFSFRLQRGSQNAMFGPQMLTILGTVLPAMSFVFMSFQPGSVQLYFMTTGILAFGTTALMRQSWFRNWADLGPLPETIPTATPPTPTGPSQTAYTTPQQLPANMQRIVPVKAPSPAVIQAEARVDTSRSTIDRAVDKVKGKWANLKETTLAKDGVYGKRMAKQEEDQKQAAAARYSAMRQQQLNADRKQRNEAARNT